MKRIANDAELRVTINRIDWFTRQLIHLRGTEANPTNFHASASGFISELDRMQLEAREYLSVHPSESNGILILTPDS